MALRLTAQYIEVAVTGATINGFRVEAQNVDVAGNVDLEPAFRVEAQNVDVAGTVDLEPAFRVEAQNVDVAGNVDLDPSLRLTTIYVEVVKKNDHRGLSGQLGTIQSGLATDTFQLGAGSGGPSFFEPVNTGKLGSRSSLLGGHMQVGSPANAVPDAEQGINILELTQEATSSIKSLSAENTIELTDEGDYALPQIFDEDADNTISLTDEARTPIVDLEASNTIVLTIIGDSGVAEIEASNTISITQSADKTTPILTVGASSILSLTDTNGTNILLGFGESTLALTDSAIGGGPIDRDADNDIDLDHEADFDQSIFVLDAENELTLTVSIETNIKQIEAITPDSGGFTDTWDSIARIPEEYELEAENTVGPFTQDLPQPSGIRSYFIEDTIEFESLGDIQTKQRNPETTITLTQEAVGDKILSAVSTVVFTDSAVLGAIELSAENELVLNDVARFTPFELQASNTLVLSQELISNIKNADGVSTLELEQDLNVQRPWYVNATSLIIEINQEFDPGSGSIIDVVVSNLTDEATVIADPLRQPSHNIPLLQQVKKTLILTTAVDVSASNTINFVQSTNTNQTGDAENQLTLTDEADAFMSDDGVSQLGLDNVASVQAETTIAAVNQLLLKQAVGYTLERNNTTCYYSPFVGSSDDPDLRPAPRPALPEEYIDAPAGVRFRLVDVPFEDGVPNRIVDLRAPEFGNSERLQTTRINRESIGGTLQVFSDPEWPRVHQLVMQFAGLKQEQARELLDFIEDTLGAEIGLLDHERRIWRAIITNPNEAIIQDSRTRYSATIEFEAERVHQHNVAAFTGLGVGQSTIDDTPTVASSSLSLTHEGDYELFPLGAGVSPLSMSQAAAVDELIPVAAGTSTIPLLHVASGRNATFRPEASSPIILSQSSDNLDFSQFGNLRHDYDPNTITVGDGNPVTIWQDNGTVGINLTSSGSNRPILNEDALNGNNIVEFRHSSAVQRMISTSNITWWPGKVGTMFIVFTLRETLGAAGGRLLTGINPAGADQTTITLGGTGIPQRPVRYIQRGGTSIALETPQSVLSNGTTYMFMVRRNNGTISFRRDGVAQVGGSVSNPSAKSGDMYLGGLTGAGNSFDMDVARVLIYEDVMDIMDVLKVEGLLSTIYGL